ncbi:MAG: cytochrome c family protein [Planctomycetes bacterium]|nr:cytochrome c family protein [Planctomycetota bacterium]MBI3848465.1 cytochrome c family protein [Planctomycetota bacterium]
MKPALPVARVDRPTPAPATTATGPIEPVASPGIIRLSSNSPNVDPMIAEKDAPFYPSRMDIDAVGATPKSFLKSEACSECHTDIYKQWSHAIMSHSWKDPIYRAVLKRASVATNGAVDNFCIGCHTPIGLTTHTAHAGDDGTTANGVDCDSCHTVSHITGLGNGSIVLAPITDRRVLRFGPRNDGLSPFHDTTYSELHTKSEFCASCHNVTHPFNRLAVERTYDEWRDSYYHGVGTSCQDCHMAPAPGQLRVEGKSAPDGKVRSGLYAHTFIGANATLHKHFDETEQAELDTRMLQSAATVRFLEAPATARAGESLTVRVRVENVGAGHKLPTGFPEGREVWVDFKVRDGDGNEVFRLGAMRDGRTENGTKSFKAVLGDRDGNPIDLNVWEADRMLSDTRILPKGFADVEYSFPIPTASKGPLTITADLNYMSFPPYILDELLGSGQMKSEPTLMTSVGQQIELADSRMDGR